MHYLTIKEHLSAILILFVILTLLIVFKNPYKPITVYNKELYNKTYNICMVKASKFEKENYFQKSSTKSTISNLKSVCKLQAETSSKYSCYPKQCLK